MKIVHVVEPFASGIATFVRSLVENLQDDLHIIVHGERQHLMTSAEVKQRFPKGNVRFIRWKSAQREISFRKDTAAFMELYTILKRLKKQVHIDAVHLHSSKSGFLGRVACRMAGINTVIYTPNGAPFFVGNSSFSNFLYKQLERLGSIFGGRVVCCSPSELKAYNAIGIKALNINNGVDIEERPAGPLPRLSPVDRSDKKSRPELKPGKFRIVTSGRIEDQKNPALFNSIAKYFEEFHDFEFLWIGEGADRDLLTARNIVTTGWLSTEDTKCLIAASQVYLSTSVFEGLPFAVLEALALKKPVLLTDCVGNRDIVNKRLNGDLFTTEDEAIVKILQYHNNRDMLQIMGEYSQQHCEQEFDVYSTFTSYRSLYKS
ncbi:MAG: glycosyltransferase [Bacteroidetes bacterium]|nr:glycosyltransferase [Bacteroidota bacterium]